MSKLLPTLASRAAVVATATAAAGLFATLPAADPAGPTHTGPGAAQSAPAGAAGPAPVRIDVQPVSARSSALDLATGKLGAPYSWGAAGPGAFDCSGLVHWAYQQAGVDLPRTSRAQSGVGTPVSKSDLQPGDLVFFYSPVSHVGIYAGDGQIVHASTSGKPVKMGNIDHMPFNSARRV